MDTIQILLIAIGLAMDAFAVSITRGIQVRYLAFSDAMKIGLIFGIFQGGMPILGWLGGTYIQEYIKPFDHWIAFILLGGIGGKMIYETFQQDESPSETKPFHNITLIFLGIATSIDALAIGVSFGVLELDIAMRVIIIGIITFLLSLSGVYIGESIGHFFEGRVEIIGGIILVGIGLKILLQGLI